MGRRLDDITSGEQVTGRSITIGEWHVMTFAGLTGDFYPLHTDEEFARETDFGGRIAHGLLTFVVGAGFLANELSSWDVIAALGFGATRFVAPVKFGDFFDEGETEAIALSGAFLAVGVESFEGAGCGEVGHAGALVGDREGEIFSAFPEGESHFSTSRRKLNGVFEEVVEGGPEEGFVSEKGKIGGEFGMQGDFRDLGQR